MENWEDDGLEASIPEDSGSFGNGIENFVVSVLSYVVATCGYEDKVLMGVGKGGWEGEVIRCLLDLDN